MANDLEQQLVDVTRRFAAGDVDGALARMAELEQGCATDAERAEVMARYATFFHLLDLRDEALAAVARGLALDPCNPRARYLNALQLMIDERWDEAITELNKAARYYPPDDGEHLAEVYGNLSYCWAQLGDAERADMYDEICADLDPDGVAVEEIAGAGAWLEGFEVPGEGESEGVEEAGKGKAVAGAIPEVELTGSEQIAEMVRELTPRSRRRECRARRGVPKVRSKAERGGEEGPRGEVETQKASSRRRSRTRSPGRRKSRGGPGRPRSRRA